jgi:hypothetical protein
MTAYLGQLGKLKRVLAGLKHQQGLLVASQADQALGLFAKTFISILNYFKYQACGIRRQKRCQLWKVYQKDKAPNLSVISTCNRNLSKFLHEHNKIRSQKLIEALLMKTGYPALRR